MPGTGTPEPQPSLDSALLQQLFTNTQNLDDDFDFLRQRWTPGTCEWILEEPHFRLWLEEELGSRLAWYNAPPASGKSILAAHIVNHIRDLGQYCQYFSYQYGDHTKRSTTALLKCIGLQMAQDVPEFKREMLKLSREGVTLDGKNAQFIWHKIFVSVLPNLALGKPFYWIIDALDESDSPEALLILLRSLSRLRTSISVFILSRRKQSLSFAFDDLSLVLPVHIIQSDGQESITTDIRTHVERCIKYMRGTEQLKMQVMENIVRRSEGSFLWANLVLEEILGCHTQKAIQQTLDDLPAEMAPMYHRMELVIENNPKEADRILAKRLLTWIVGAYRPLNLQELSQALAAEFPDFLDLERSIQEVCGQFVVIDRSKHAALVHKTARDYLTQTPNLHFYIDEKEAHEELFGKTLSFLLRPNLRSKLGWSRQATRLAEPFLLYAATSFMYHLRQASTTSEGVMDMLATFLRGYSVLTWIHSLALFGELEVLVTAARVLIWFGGLNGKLDMKKNPSLQRLQDLKLFELWAIDLVKITAKFGRHLLEDPMAIYEIVPPLCPQESIMSRQFKQTKRQVLSISGISNAGWYDCLTTLCLPNGVKALHLACAGTHIAVSGSTGSITLWDSANFEETCIMRHVEPVTRMCFNTERNQLVSYGLKTIKIWAVPSGLLVGEIPSPVDDKALAITFTEKDTKILVGFGDKTLRYFHVNALEKGWRSSVPALLEEDSIVDGGLFTSPSFMAFNADATQVAVAYRGYPLSVWATNEHRLIRRCRRAVEHRKDHASRSVSWMPVDRVAWNPVVESLVGLYKDGCIFKWNPVSDEYQEECVFADEIQVSPDGKLFVTSDTNGMVKVWDFFYLSVIYQLASEDMITALAFSPDGRRFYDLRGSSIHAWEPDSILRFLNDVESESDTASDDQASRSVSHISKTWPFSREPISALAAAPGSQLYCTSRGYGKIDLFDKTHGKLLDMVDFPASSTIDHLVEHLTWGEDGKHIAAAELSGNIIVKRLKTSGQTTGKPQFEAESLLAGKIKPVVGGIDQILLSGDSSRLLVVSKDFCQVWSTETGKLAFSGELEKAENRKWLNHPLQRTTIMGIGSRTLMIVDWTNLKVCARFDYHEDCLRFDSRSSSDIANAVDSPERALSPIRKTGFKEDPYVERSMITQDGEHLLVQLHKTFSHGKKPKHLLIFETPPLSPPDNPNPPPPLHPINLPSEVTNKIEVPLGILPGKKLVFLDKNLWMCTLKFNSRRQSTAPKRHYFIPRDWASTDSLAQCCLLQDGTFLCPKGDEVAVIASGLAETSW